MFLYAWLVVCAIRKTWIKSELAMTIDFHFLSYDLRVILQILRFANFACPPGDLDF